MSAETTLLHDLHELFGELVDALEDTVRADEVVVGKVTREPFGGLSRMARDVHALLYSHGLIETGNRPFEDIEALSIS
jgi:hypothetical protein